MSSADRKLGFYCLEFKYYGNQHTFFDNDIFLSLLEYIQNSLSDHEKMLNNQNTNKSMGLEWYEIYERDHLELIKIVLKSCKYNHSPNYISSEDGSERESDKNLKEGEKEATHLLCKRGNNELEIILEERRSGATIGNIIKYFNHHLKRYVEINSIDPKFIVAYSRVPVDDIEKAIDNLSRICSADIFTHKNLLTSGGLDIMDRSDVFMKDEIMISCGVKRGESLLKSTAKNIYHSLVSQGEETSRVRIRGKDGNNVGITIDSYFTKKIERVNVALIKERGTVDSFALFAKMEDIFGVEE
ncbi:hypothetical protein [Acetobacterium bakii]|uniref:Uncharacterized protein n=1 Tax=Acetobacterium bakii TaxID=52689 RepID=A0A0L6TWG4_9FIRM|nr:hypothetical protein [Acetobacterium bakii]KNZ40603.1 hypothetical protein AKG39_16795 [Acetobacterium bakii]